MQSQNRIRKNLSLEKLEVRQLMAADLDGAGLVATQNTDVELTASASMVGVAAEMRGSYADGPAGARGGPSPEEPIPIDGPSDPPRLHDAWHQRAPGISLPGDYNSDGLVDIADYTVWRDAFGQSGPGLAADGNRDGLVDQTDFELWRDHVGTGTTPVDDDSFEENDSPETASDLGTISQREEFSDLVMADDVDWYRFQTDRLGDDAAHVTVRFSHDEGDLDIQLFDSAGQLVNFSTSTTDAERISLTGLPAGEYLLAVYGYQGATNPHYALEIDPGRDSTQLDDRFEENDSPETASDLGTISGRQEFSELVMADEVDWYRFQTDRPGDDAAHITVRFSHDQGDLDIQLFDSAGQLVNFSNSATDTERMSLAELPAGEYILAVYGYQGASNPRYSIEIDPGRGVQNNGTLWLNFDGASITNQQLRNWAGNDWSGSLAWLDPGGDGIAVQPFLATVPQREQIIELIIASVQHDLSPYSVEVRRWDGLAVEGQGDTTVFIGPNGLTNPADGSPMSHVASDVDYGNNNRTDIAFVGDEWWNNAQNTAIAIADVVLHEAGHTFGLCHVDTRVNGVALPESMGLRYSSQQSEWVQDTWFMDRTFVEHSNHCNGLGSQNSHRTMLRNFGLSSTTPPSSLVRYASDPSGVFMLTTSAGSDVIEIEQFADGTVEMDVNGHVYQLSSNTRRIQIFTEGDVRDEVNVSGALGIELIVDESAASRMLHDKRVPEAIATWDASPASGPDSGVDHSSEHGPGCCCAGCRLGAMPAEPSVDSSVAQALPEVPAVEREAPLRSMRRIVSQEPTERIVGWGLTQHDSASVAESETLQPSLWRRHDTSHSSLQELDEAFADLEWTRFRAPLLRAV